MRAGFTLVELLVVVAIVGLLSSYTVIYSNTTRRNTELYVEKARVGQFILKAKSFTLSTKNRTSLGRPCGYGVEMQDAVAPDRPALAMFSYSVHDPSSYECKQDAITLLPLSRFDRQEVERFELTKGVRFLANSSQRGELTRVFFLAPDPQVFLWIDGAAPLPGVYAGNIYLETEDGRANTSIRVASGGEVSF